MSRRRRTVVARGTIAAQAPRAEFEAAPPEAATPQSSGEAEARRLVAAHRYVVFGFAACPWCKRALALIRAQTGEEPLFVDVRLRPELAPPASMASFSSVPKVFADGRLVGGYEATRRHFGVEEGEWA